jgi:hypothetical protein
MRLQKQRNWDKKRKDSGGAREIMESPMDAKFGLRGGKGTVNHILIPRA